VTEQHGAALAPRLTIYPEMAADPERWLTGGFSEFVPLPFVHMAAPIYLQRRSRLGPTLRETVLMHAVGRIADHSSIRNVPASWVKIGGDGVRQLLRAVSTTSAAR